jgi:hypothetical protein
MDQKLLELAIDTIKNKVPSNYSKTDTSEALRQAFIDANGGSTKIDIKSFRKHPELYEIMEEIIPVMIQEGLTGDEFFMNFVDYRNIALGDEIDFWAEDNSTFLVATIAEGLQSVRRQRLDAGEKVTIGTSLKAIKIYEELNRLLCWTCDFNRFVQKVSEAMTKEIYAEVYAEFNGISATTAGMSSDYYKTGSFSEDILLGLIDHTESANGGSAVITGTRSALRKVTSAVVSESAKEDMYGMGYYGKFNGTPMVVVRQRHAVGTDTFLLDDSKIYVTSGNEKFIKMVNEGTGLILDSDPMLRNDIQKEYLYTQRFGSGLLLSTRLSVYSIS